MMAVLRTLAHGLGIAILLLPFFGLLASIIFCAVIWKRDC